MTLPSGCRDVKMATSEYWDQILLSSDFDDVETAAEATTAIAGGTAKGHAPHCPPKTAESALLHAPLSTRLDEISFRRVPQSEPFFGPFGPPGRPRGPLPPNNCAEIPWGCPCGARLRAPPGRGQPWQPGLQAGPTATPTPAPLRSARHHAAAAALPGAAARIRILLINTE